MEDSGSYQNLDKLRTLHLTCAQPVPYVCSVFEVGTEETLI
jgi:hypothetical protein